jgi:ABC-2 type transport system permease protein
MPADSIAQRAGVIHDIGYQRYEGPRLGRAYAVRSLYVHGLRSAFGLGRSVKAKIFPWFVIGIMMFIAIISVVIRSQTGSLGISYLDFPQQAGLLSVLFLCSAAPELLSRDLRSKVLPLYFSRPITRTDYALAKLGATVTAVWLVLAGPILFMFLGSAFSLAQWSDIFGEFADFLGGVALAAIYAFVLGVIGALLSSFFGRRMVAAAVIVGYFLLTAALSGVIEAIFSSDAAGNVGRLISPLRMVEGLKVWLFQVHGGEAQGFDASTYGPWFAVVTALFVLIGTWLIVLRYRKVAA